MKQFEEEVQVFVLVAWAGVLAVITACVARDSIGLVAHSIILLAMCVIYREKNK